MSSSYTGLYVQCLSDGIIHNVQVVDTAGISIPLDPDTYIERDVKPPIDQLPDQEDYNQNI
jgi:hypothetical protein